MTWGQKPQQKSSLSGCYGRTVFSQTAVISTEQLVPRGWLPELGFCPVSSAALCSAGPGTVLMRSAGSPTCLLRKWPHRADAGRRGGVQTWGTRGMDLGARLLRGRHTLPENQPVGRLHLCSAERIAPWSPGLSIRRPARCPRPAGESATPCVRGEAGAGVQGGRGFTCIEARLLPATLRLFPPRAAPVPCLLR